jgi:hypothetical protein
MQADLAAMIADWSETLTFRASEITGTFSPLDSGDDLSEAGLLETAQAQFVCDADEFVYHPDIVSVLKNSKATVIHPTFHNMFSDVFPTTDGQIYDEVTMGTPDGDFWLSKMNLFKPKEITAMKWAMGCHYAYPEGNVIIDDKSGIKTLHMNFLSRQYLINRYKRNSQRHSEKDRINGWGVQSFWSEEQINKYFDEQLPRLIKIV